MKNLLKNIKNNPLTIIFAIIGGFVMGFATYAVAQLYFTTLPQWLCIIFAIVAAIVTIVLVFVLGWDNVKAAVLRSAKKTLTAENYDALVETVTTLETAQNEQKQAEVEKAAKDEEVEQAKTTIAEYEAQIAQQEALKTAYENAKAIVANSQSTETQVENSNNQ